MDRPEEALEAVDRSLELCADDAHTHLVRAWALERLERAEDTRAAVEKAIEIDPKRRGAHETLGKALWSLGRRNDAVEAFREGVKLEPENAGLRFNFALSLDRLGRFPEALAAYEETVRLDPANARAHAARGRLLQAEGKDAAALEAFQKAVALGYTTADCEYRRGILAFFHLGAYEKALSAFDKAIELGCPTADVHYYRALALQNLRRSDEAQKALCEVLKRDPDYALAYAALAPHLHRTGKLHEALAAVEKAIELGHSEPRVHFNAGIILRSLDRHDQAIEAFAKVLELNPAHPHARNCRGASLAQLGRFEEAHREFELQVRDHPEDIMGRANLALSLLYRLRDPERALPAFDAAMKLDPSWPGLRLGRARALWLLGRHDQAIESIETLLEAAPEDPDVLVQASWFLARHPDPEKRNAERAVELARRAIVRRNEGVGGWRALGLAFYRSNRCREACQALKMARDLSAGGEVRDWLLTAMALARLGERDEAREWYDRAVAGLEAAESGHGDVSDLLAEAEELMGR
jgi:tetratricopeptide (TPR) repeat protein